MVRFLKPIPYHLNVGQSDGQVCIGLLKSDQWNPAVSCIESLLTTIFAALARPQPDSFVDDDVNTTYMHKRSVYEEKARLSVKAQ